MRIFVAIAFSLGIFIAGSFWHKTHHEVIELSLDIGFRALQRLAFDETGLGQSPAHLTENVRAELTIKGRQTPVLLEALPAQANIKLSAIKVTVDEKDEFEPRHMLLLNKNALERGHMVELARSFQILESPLYVNGKKIADFILLQEPFYHLVSDGNGPIVRQLNGAVELSEQSKQLPIMADILKREESKLPADLAMSWWYWNKEQWVKLGNWPAGWPL